MAKDRKNVPQLPAEIRKLIPAERTETEITVVNSRFIAVCAPVFSSEDARAFIISIQNEHPAANHHVPAYIIGHGASTMAYCSDDGEPSGSSGRPILSVLQGSGFGDIVVVVTRYFGGTKLGIGGLVRAYSDAAKAVLNEVPRAEKLLTDTFQFSLEYGMFERIKLHLADQQVSIIEEVFTDQVLIRARCLSNQMKSLEADLIELTNGKVSLEILTQNEETIVPV